MKNILIVVDMQNGFTRYKQTQELVKRVKKLLELEVFDCILATKFINYNNSIYESLFDWHRLKSETDIKLCDFVDKKADEIIEKSIYTCVNAHFIQRLCQLNGGEYPSRLFIVGADTDCCVLKIATDLFEYNIRPIVLVDYCASNGGLESHSAGILCLERLIGKKQLYNGEITNVHDLELI